ncbi:hypothetical protein M422DRAFT_250367 [Sphaerobolus stellatus SS14]|uniref:Uncharacterized protein n=1 Tax=Sphaerobolus stellatus (strain SS14) TaxID=990650 RepID=A0A0C9VH13_SPHS4|nr:hypothetical protein M422DRAFT_250367 [Sphaerobolus stellatus SS14]
MEAVQNVSAASPSYQNSEWRRQLLDLEENAAALKNSGDISSLLDMLQNIGELILALSRSITPSPASTRVLKGIYTRIVSIICDFTAIDSSLWTDAHIQCLCLLAFVLWGLCSQVIINCSEEDRNTLLDILEPLTIPCKSEAGLIRPNLLPATPSNPSYLQLSGSNPPIGIRTPSLQDSARLCAGVLYNKITASLGNSEDSDEVDQRLRGNNILSFDWTSCIAPPLQSSNKVQDSNLVSRIEGIWSGAFFIPCTTIEDDDKTSTPNTFIFQTPISYELQEYYSVDEDLCIPFEIDNTNEAPFLRAWFPEGFKCHKKLDSLLAYDPVNNRWVTYHSSDQIMPGAKIADTIIVGNSICTNERDKNWYHDYRVYGRKNPKDDSIAFIRQPALKEQSFLGRWLFCGRVYNDEFVGEWSVTSQDRYSSGEQELVAAKCLNYIPG